MDTMLSEFELVKRRKRRVWSDDEKRMICAQTRVPGVSVSQVARRYDVNPNRVLIWLKDPRFFSAEEAGGQACFLPVENSGDVRHEDDPPVAAGGRIEFDLAGGHRLTISGTCDPNALAVTVRTLLITRLDVA
jgi:transposase